MCIVICTLLLSCPARGAWVEIATMMPYALVEVSCPARGAWVEIYNSSTQLIQLPYVAPRKGRVG